MGITRVFLLDANLPINSLLDSVFNNPSVSARIFRLYFFDPFLSLLKFKKQDSRTFLSLFLALFDQIILFSTLVSFPKLQIHC